MSFQSHKSIYHNSQIRKYCKSTVWLVPSQCDASVVSSALASTIISYPETLASYDLFTIWMFDEYTSAEDMQQVVNTLNPHPFQVELVYSCGIIVKSDIWHWHLLEMTDHHFKDVNSAFKCVAKVDVKDVQRLQVLAEKESEAFYQELKALYCKVLSTDRNVIARYVLCSGFFYKAHCYYRVEDAPASLKRGLETDSDDDHVSKKQRLSGTTSEFGMQLITLIHAHLIVLMAECSADIESLYSYSFSDASFVDASELDDETF